MPGLSPNGTGVSTHPVLSLLLSPSLPLPTPPSLSGDTVLSWDEDAARVTPRGSPGQGALHSLTDFSCFPVQCPILLPNAHVLCAGYRGHRMNAHDPKERELTAPQENQPWTAAALQHVVSARGGERTQVDFLRSKCQASPRGMGSGWQRLWGKRPGQGDDRQGTPCLEMECGP